MPAVSSVTWAPEGAEQGYEPVNSVLKEEPAHGFAKMKERGKCYDQSGSPGSGWVMQLFLRAVVAPTESALPALPSWVGRLQGVADCSTDRWLLKQQFRDLNLGFPSPPPSCSIPLTSSRSCSRGGTLASSLGTLFTGGPGAKGQQGPLWAPGNLLLHLKLSLIRSSVCLSM